MSIASRTNHEPKAGVSTQELLSRLRADSPAKLRQRLSGDLDVIVLKALRKEPQRRYPSVEQLAEDIRRHLQGLPVSAVPDSLPYRARKFVQRHTLGVAASAVILLVIAVGLAATLREARIAAVNERRAEQRFNDVRKLANSLMFEIHDAIVDLPGSTPARKLLVQRSLEYLNSLSHEALGDTSLQRELATAYERIGLVQGNPEGSNLGDISGALDSFGRALAIREKIANPSLGNNLADQISLAASYREMCGMYERFLGSISKALDHCGKAVNVMKALQVRYPENNSVKAELARAYATTGRVDGENSSVGSAGDSYAALENQQKALELVQQLMHASPEDLNLRSWHGKLSYLTADALFGVGRLSEALPLYQQATLTFEDLTGKSNNPAYERSLLFGYQRMGDMLLIDGRYAQSVTYYRKQLKVATELATADPKNMLFRMTVAGSRATLGHALWRAGFVTEGVNTLRHGLADLADSGQEDSKTKGLEITLRGWLAGGLEKKGDFDEALHNYLLVRDADAAICKSDPSDLEDCLGFAGTQDRIARIDLRRGNPEKALAEYQDALTISEPSIAGPKPNLEALYTIVNIYYGMGEAYAALANRSARHAAQEANPSSNQACTWYQKSNAASLRIPEWRPITPNEFDSRDPKDIAARLLSCPEAERPAKQ